MKKTIKTFWYNIGEVDVHLEVPARIKLLKTLGKVGVNVRTNINYFKKKPDIKGLNKVWTLKVSGKNILSKILLIAKHQILLFRNQDVDIIVVRYKNLFFAIPLWFYLRKLLGRKKPCFVLDVRSLAVDLKDNWVGILEQKRFDKSIDFAFKNFDGVMAITEKMKKDLQNNTNNYNKN